MNGKTAYQCIECKKPLSHATGVNIAIAGKPVLIHRSRCLSVYNRRHKKAAKTLAFQQNAKEKAAQGAITAILEGHVMASPQAIVPIQPEAPPLPAAQPEPPPAPTPVEEPEPVRSPHLTHLGQLVRQYRVAQGLSLRGMALAMGMPETAGTSWLWQVETRRVHRITPKLDKLAQVLGLSHQELQQAMSRGPKLGSNLAPDGVPQAWKAPVVAIVPPVVVDTRGQLRKMVRKILSTEALEGFTVDEVATLLSVAWGAK